MPPATPNPTLVEMAKSWVVVLSTWKKEELTDIERKTDVVITCDAEGEQPGFTINGRDMAEAGRLIKQLGATLFIREHPFYTSSMHDYFVDGTGKFLLRGLSQEYKSVIDIGDVEGMVKFCLNHVLKE